MPITQGLYTSKTDIWATPQSLFNDLNSVFNFDLDVCANQDNAKCKKYFNEEQNGLIQTWKGMCFLNPPYGTKIGFWIKKAHEESIKNFATIVCILPSRTDTRYMHDYVFAHSNAICFMKGRVKFGDGKAPAPFPSMIAVFSNKQVNKEQKNILNKYGHLVIKDDNNKYMKY